jgi:phenol/toluene 2-monooxygenase (NADH) P5/A5
MTEIYTVTVEPVGREITCREDQSILDACLRAGVWVPHSCTHGTCGTCKAEVLDGDVDHGDASAFALMDFERDEGKLLLCTATPRSDVVVEADVDVDDDLPVHPIADFTGTVVEMEEIANDTRRVILEIDSDLEFNPGQYMAWHLPASIAKGATRTYSMGNAPSDKRRLEFQIRRTAGGACSDKWVFGPLAVGDQVPLTGPYGRFVLRVTRPEPIVMIAGGTGLAPIASMIKHALAEGVEIGPITLYQGARTREWLYDTELFRGLEAEYPGRFTYVPCLSEEEADGYESGLVTDVLSVQHETLAGYVAYVCGPPGMVDAALKTLMAKRLFPRDIYREEFLSEADRAQGAVRSPLIKR